MNTLTHEQLVEQTARAQWAVISDDANSWDTLGQDEKDEQFARVRAVISTIAEATKEPTEAADLTRPIIGIENRTAQEVFDIMCDRIKLAPPAPANSQGSLDGSGDRESPVGWLFFNPDAGVEFSENHPIESGEVTDAENIREATSETLLEELLSAWKDWEADRQILDEYKNAADDPVKAQLVEALKEIRATIKNSEKWWMDCPTRGGFDVEKIDAALAAAEAEENKNKG